MKIDLYAERMMRKARSGLHVSLSRWKSAPDRKNLRIINGPDVLEPMGWVPSVSRIGLEYDVRLNRLELTKVTGRKGWRLVKLNRGKSAQLQVPLHPAIPAPDLETTLKEEVPLEDMTFSGGGVAFVWPFAQAKSDRLGVIA